MSDPLIWEEALNAPPRRGKILHMEMLSNEAFILECEICGPWWIVASRRIAETTHDEHVHTDGHTGATLCEASLANARGKQLR